MKTKFKQLVLIAAISAGYATSALAANAPFTLTPSDANPSLTTNTGSITADTFQGFDNATLTITHTLVNGVDSYNATETGIFSVQSFTLGGNALSSNQLAGLNSGGADSWGLYLQFSATSKSATFLQSQTPLTTFDFQMFGDPNANGIGKTQFTPAGGIVGGTNSTDVLLASGQLLFGSASLNAPPFNLSLQVVASFLVDNSQLPTGVGSFFTAPENFYINIGASATAFAGANLSSNCPVTGPAVGGSCSFTITGGAPTAGFSNPVPEPGILALLGVGMLGFGVQSKKRKA